MNLGEQSADERIRGLLYEAQWHARLGMGAFKTLDILKGYDQARWRLDCIDSLLTDIDNALDVLVSLKNVPQSRVDGKVVRVHRGARKARDFKRG